jgi:hypothetical protein
LQAFKQHDSMNDMIRASKWKWRKRVGTEWSIRPNGLDRVHTCHSNSRDTCHAQLTYRPDDDDHRTWTQSQAKKQYQVESSQVWRTTTMTPSCRRVHLDANTKSRADVWQNMSRASNRL